MAHFGTQIRSDLTQFVCQICRPYFEESTPVVDLVMVFLLCAETGQLKLAETGQLKAK